MTGWREDMESLYTNVYTYMTIISQASHNNILGRCLQRSSVDNLGHHQENAYGRVQFGDVETMTSEAMLSTTNEINTTSISLIVTP